MKTMKHVGLFPALIVLMRILFGVGWLLAGVTKITEKLWFHEPGLFLKEYLNDSLHKTNVPDFYKIFIEHIALEHVMVFNYVLPIVQIIVGIFLIAGLFTIPSILSCLFMHINFILSGNMNGISLVLYTNAFSLLIFRIHIYHFSLDKYWHLEGLLSIDKNKQKTMVSIPSNKERVLYKTE